MKSCFDDGSFAYNFKKKCVKVGSSENRNNVIKWWRTEILTTTEWQSRFCRLWKLTSGISIQVFLHVSDTVVRSPYCTGIFFTWLKKTQGGRGRAKGKLVCVLHWGLCVGVCVNVPCTEKQRRRTVCTWNVCLFSMWRFMSSSKGRGAAEERVGGVEYHYPSPSLS